MSKWKMVRLGELFDIGSSKRVFQSEWRNSGIPFYRAREIAKLASNGYVNNELFIDEKMYLEYSKKYGIPSEGDIMVTGVGTLGICYIVKNTDKFYFKDGNILWFKKTTNVNSSYISWVFRTNYLKEQIQKHSSGTTVGTFTISTAKEIEVPLPPLEEQKRIADILDKARSLIDLRKQQLEKMNLLIKSKFIDMFGDPVNNPKGWEVKKIQDVSPAISSGKRVKEGKVWLLNLDAIEANSGRVLRMDYVKLCDLSNSTLAFDLENVLYSKLRPYLNKVVLPKNEGFATTELVPLRPNKEYLTREFLTYLLRCESFVRYISEKVAGAKMPRVSMSDLRGFSLILPPLPLQDQFAEFVEQVEKQKAVMQQSLEKMETNYKALMQEYFG